MSDEPATTDETNNAETRHVFVLTRSQAKTTKGKKETLPSIQEELKADQGEMGKTSNPAASPKMRGRPPTKKVTKEIETPPAEINKDIVASLLATPTPCSQQAAENNEPLESRAPDFAKQNPVPIIETTSTSTSSEGSVLVDKKNKTLDSLLKAYKARLQDTTDIPPRLMEYPNPIQEKVNLVKHQAWQR